MTFLYGAKSTADFSATNVSQKLGVDLQPDAERGVGWFVYRSPDLGDGWTYGVRVAPGQPPFKPGFHFWFEKHQTLSEPARICALPSDLLEADLVKHGFAQANAWSELGWSHDLILSRGDIVFSLARADEAGVGIVRCVVSLQTTDSLARPTVSRTGRRATDDFPGRWSSEAPSLTSAARQQPPARPQTPSPAAADVLRKLVDIVTRLASTRQLTPGVINEHFGQPTRTMSGASLYQGGELGDGWTYSLRYNPPSAEFKPGFEFGFHNRDAAADPASVCALKYRAFRQTLLIYGFREELGPFENGGLSSASFVSGDVAIVVSTRDVMRINQADQCIMSLRTSDRR